MLPAGQDALLRRILDPPEGLPDGFAFESASAEGSKIEARYRNGGASTIVRLVHVREAQAGDLIIGSLALRNVAELPESLVRALEVSLLAREHRVEWRELGPDAEKHASDVDPEWCALSAGIQSVLRVRVSAEDAALTRQRYESFGAVVLSQEVPPNRAILYVARDPSDAERTRELERHLLADETSLSDRRALAEELGWALGHPSCCVEAYVARMHPSGAALVGSYLAGNLGTLPYRAARDAWVPRPLPRLNPFLRHAGRSFVSFQPCRYDCPHALALADRVAGACALANREWLAETDRVLARPVVICPDGGRAIVALERRIEPMRVIETEALSDAPSDRDLARRLVGAEAPDDGLFRRRGLGWCLLVDFGWIRPGFGGGAAPPA